jgi:hypothetical protein
VSAFGRVHGISCPSSACSVALGPVVNSPDLAESHLQHPASISHRLDGCWFRRASFFDS